MNISDKIPNEPSLDEKQCKGTRILVGTKARRYLTLQTVLQERATMFGAIPIILPSIEPSAIYEEKAGPEVRDQMFTFKDKGDRDLCLRPEATATCQILGKSTFKTYRDLKLFYWQRCYRYERPQAGRYREFTQFGIEVLNPTKDWTAELINMGCLLLTDIVPAAEIKITVGVKRGLGIYNAEGFEFSVDRLGAQKQILGGGPYDGGYGFALGIDRLLLLGE